MSAPVSAPSCPGPGGDHHLVGLDPLGLELDPATRQPPDPGAHAHPHPEVPGRAVERADHRVRVEDARPLDPQRHARLRGDDGALGAGGVEVDGRGPHPALLGAAGHRGRARLVRGEHQGPAPRQPLRLAAEEAAQHLGAAPGQGAGRLVVVDREPDLRVARRAVAAQRRLHLEQGHGATALGQRLRHREPGDAAADHHAARTLHRAEP